jgi:hypothetical protein
MAEQKTTCVNCGPLSKGTLMTRCRMVDRCTASQAREYINAGEPVPEYLAGRPLCVICSGANQYTCWVCELEALEEKKK